MESSRQENVSGVANDHEAVVVPGNPRNPSIATPELPTTLSLFETLPMELLTLVIV